MLLEVGEKVHVVERRFFEHDVKRHVVGEIVKCGSDSIRIKGYVWSFHAVCGEFVKKRGKRERVIYADKMLITNVLPPDVDLEQLRYISNQDGHALTDGGAFLLEVSDLQGIG